MLGELAILAMQAMLAWVVIVALKVTLLMNDAMLGKQVLVVAVGL